MKARALLLDIWLQIILICLFQLSQAEEVSTSLFLDTYYAVDNNQEGIRRRPYTTQPLFEGEPAVNLAYLDTSLKTESVRGRIAIQGGSSVDSNYAAEPENTFRYLQEGYAGIKLDEALWADAGVFLSHIGLESWISRDNWVYTRALVSDFSPYYQSGGRVQYEYAADSLFGIHLLNGWQNISDDRSLALGTQLTHTFSKSLSFSHNTFLGDEEGERFFNNMIIRYRLNDRFEFSGAFDLGYQDRDRARSSWWHGGVLMGRIRLGEDLYTTVRIEGYSDPEGIILSAVSGGSFKAFGGGVNIDYQVTPQVLLRGEYRILGSSDEIFPLGDGGYRNLNNLFVISVAFTVEQLHKIVG